MRLKLLHKYTNSCSLTQPGTWVLLHSSSFIFSMLQVWSISKCNTKCCLLQFETVWLLFRFREPISNSWINCVFQSCIWKEISHQYDAEIPQKRKRSNHSPYLWSITRDCFLLFIRAKHNSIVTAFLKAFYWILLNLCCVGRFYVFILCSILFNKFIPMVSIGLCFTTWRCYQFKSYDSEFNVSHLLICWRCLSIKDWFLTGNEHYSRIQSPR